MLLTHTELELTKFLIITIFTTVKIIFPFYAYTVDFRAQV